LGKLIELPHAYQKELDAEIEELEVLMALARACLASTAILENQTTKAALRDAIAAVMEALSISGVINER
jgi:hypothetical protein